MTRHPRPSPPTLLVLAVTLLSACGTRTPPVTRPPAPAPVDAVLSPRALGPELDRIFGAPGFGRMQWAVLVKSLDSGEVLYAREPAKLMMPASNMKIVTLAAAAERLGWDYRFTTVLRTSAPIENGVLGGDLVVVGGGDPSINGRDGSPTRIFEEWADRLKAAGITRIQGRIVADARAFAPAVLGGGWAWDYLGYGYAAPIGALQYNEDLADLVVQPGAAVGAPALVDVLPAESGLAVDSRVTTVASGAASIELERLPGSNRLVVTGTVGLDAGRSVRGVAVDDPSAYFARVLRSTLVARGVRVDGAAVALTAPPAEAAQGPADDGGRALVERFSPPLSEIARVLMKVSQNLYAETLLRTLGTLSGKDGSAEAGQLVVRDTLTGWGIPAESYVLADGSGLSRYNYVSAGMIVAVLERMHRDATHRDAFQATLPIGGRDGGTIARRFKGTRAEGNVRAKTGSISNVRALSGYVTTIDGETLVFSVLANGFTQPSAVIDEATDLAVTRLASLKRRGK